MAESGAWSYSRHGGPIGAVVWGQVVPHKMEVAVHKGNRTNKWVGILSFILPRYHRHRAVSRWEYTHALRIDPGSHPQRAMHGDIAFSIITFGMWVHQAKVKMQAMGADAFL